MTIQENISLRPYNTFGIDAIARFFVEINSVDDLKELISKELYWEKEVFILGGGSNVLLTQNFNGLVVKMNIPGIEVVEENENFVWVRAGAGENWHMFVLHCIARGYGGVENLSLIPGTLGAAPMQNIGAYGVEIQDVFECLEAVNLSDGKVKQFSHEECQFGYRESVFKHSLKGKYIITHVTLRLSKQPEVNTTYGAIEETLKEMRAQKGYEARTPIEEVSEAVIRIRKSKLPDPLKIGNAGSFFKNPVIEASKFESLQQAYPHVPGYQLPDKKVKVPAGWLIEQCGWKGKKVGNTGVHSQQALVLINHGGAQGNEVRALAMEIKDSVWEKFDIEISPEVNII
ncbi:UDP-N-acetylmuramate dehydrogenase [Catalinimonas alkaloidigena]|uniref:UDP-N-acetylmuramate dehydrogenase n=1 Tax=Catalinimonas alkaloidigena TaxID=1075417 RepID=UPI0024050936|nr:UDP-N-acetylmuramate dehydrogenase [Catalinimonas alkaloidigena]MDF9799532.1 UDP-N-acetylmuramate dehydrogenase [Catalinimonas alkaloidigena]